MNAPLRKVPRAQWVRLARLALPVVKDASLSVGAFWRRANGGLADLMQSALLAETAPDSLPPVDEAPAPFAPARPPDAVVLSSQWMRMGEAKLAGYTPLMFAGTTYHIDREGLLFWCRLAGIAVDYTADLAPVGVEAEARQ